MLLKVYYMTEQYAQMRFSISRGLTTELYRHLIDRVANLTVCGITMYCKVKKSKVEAFKCFIEEYALSRKAEITYTPVQIDDIAVRAANNKVNLITSTEAELKSLHRTFEVLQKCNPEKYKEFHQWKSKR